MRKHEQGKALTFGRLQAAPAPEAPVVAVPMVAAAGAEVTTAARPPVIAVIAVHGMGSQLPFQTLDDVASRLADITEAREARQVSLRARAVKAGEDRLSRLELDIDQGRRSVHVYEVYWAPLTEGRIGVWDVVTFLVDAGWNSLWSVGRQFTRWMFGGPQNLDIAPGTRGYVALTLGVVLGLVGLNAAAIAIHGLRAGGKLTGWTLLFAQDLTAGLFLVAVAATVFVVLLGLCAWIWSRKRGRGATSLSLPRALTATTWFAFFVTTFGVVAVTAWLAYVAACHRLGADGHWLHPTGVFTKSWALTGAFALVLVVSWFVKGFLVQRVGDVAAYVFSHRLDRFDEIRTAIKARAAKTANAVYEMADRGRWVYDRVIFVGHSLGSVVAYDTINRLLSDDDAANGAMRILNRTKMMLTFGSPLDKTAFLFRMQGSNDRYGREALAATVQPLIQDARFRPARLEWVNVYADKGADILGSKLDYYDDPHVPPVRNVPDPDASVPIAAHDQLWQTDVVWTALYDRLMTC